MNRMVRMLSASVLVCALHADARACSMIAPTHHVVDPSMQATDQTPPMLPPVTVQHITRGKGPDGCAVSSCDDLGNVTFRAQATDDVTAPVRIGYRFALEAGTLPQGLALPTDAIEPYGDDLVLHWPDGATDDQESIDFTLRVVAIDLAGNESAPQSVRISDDRGGCAVARGHTARPGSIAWLALLVAAGVRRRGRR